MTIDARKILFKSGRPNIRPMELDDVRWLWAAHRMQDKKEIRQEDFMDYVSSSLEKFAKIYIVEDVNAKFSNGTGPVGLFVADFDGWNLEPHVEFFPWATDRNKIKSVVGFLTFQRFQKDIGCIRIHASSKFRAFFTRLKKYIPIKYGGKVLFGRPEGPDYIFYLRGNRTH